MENTKELYLISQVIEELQVSLYELLIEEKFNNNAKNLNIKSKKIKNIGEIESANKTIFYQDLVTENNLIIGNFIFKKRKFILNEKIFGFIKISDIDFKYINDSIIEKNNEALNVREYFNQFIVLFFQIFTIKNIDKTLEIEDFIFELNQKLNDYKEIKDFLK